MKLLIWIGIAFCISQSAIFSGLNLAFFSISKLRLEIEKSKNNKRALKVLALREDSNFLLTTILWGNVGINVLLTLLSKSVLTGVMAFIFSTVVITFIGEITPQAYFSRHALKMASLLSPVVGFYQILLYPVAKSTALMLDKWLGPEAVKFFQESDLQELLRMHVNASETDIEKIEGTGAINFLDLDDLRIIEEGEPIDPKSIMPLPFEGNRPVFPIIERASTDTFLRQVESSGKKWVIITDSENEPRAVIDADGFLRDALFKDQPFNPYIYCHRPIIVKDPQTFLGDTILDLKVHPARSDDDVIDKDIIIFWGETKHIITGSDILGRLLRGIVKQESAHFRTVSPDGKSHEVR